MRVLPTTAFLAVMKEAQDQTKANGRPPTWLDETEIFWNAQKQEVCVCGGGVREQQG